MVSELVIAVVLLGSESEPVPWVAPTSQVQPFIFGNSVKRAKLIAENRNRDSYSVPWDREIQELLMMPVEHVMQCPERPGEGIRSPRTE